MKLKLQNKIRLIAELDSFEQTAAIIDLAHKEPDYTKSEIKEMVKACKEPEKDDRVRRIQIVEHLRKLYPDIITMEDTREILVKKGNYYTKNSAELDEELNRLINDTNEASYKGMYGNVVADLGGQTLFDRNNFCYDPWVVNFKNGYYDVTKGEMVKDDKKFFYEIPYEYRTASCPKFKIMLGEWLGEQVVEISDMFEMMGLTMTMNTKFKLAIYLYGSPNSGKTSLLDILEAVVGDNNHSSLGLKRLGERFGTHGLQGKVLNSCGELDKSTIYNTKQIKELVGGDKTIGAEPKGKDFYQFRNVTKFWFASNWIPRLHHEDEGFYIRFILINFMNKFKPNPTYLDKVLNDPEEIAGIIHECMLGLHRLYERGGFREELTEHTERTWRLESDSLYAFLETQCTRSLKCATDCTVFIDLYNKFRMTRNETIVSSKQVTDWLKLHGIGKTRDNQAEGRPYMYSTVLTQKT